MKRIIPILLFCICFTKAKSQDMQFTQPYAASLYMNPAFAGANVCSRVLLTYRNQWPGITKAYTTQMVTVDHSIQSKHIGVGLIVVNDVAGSGVLRTNFINPILAYNFDLTRKVSVRFGMQPGLTLKSINGSRTLFGDQIARGGNVTTVEDLPQSKVFFDIGTGLLVYTSNFWIGTAFHHLTQPNESLLGNDETKLPLKASVHGGAKFAIGNDGKIDEMGRAVTFAFNYKSQAKFDQLDLGVYYRQSSVNLGFWYRGLPGKSYQPGYPNNDALAFIVGVETDRFNFGYGYDLTISKLKTLTKGSHELTISYQFCKPKKRKRKTLLVHCPKF